MMNTYEITVHTTDTVGMTFKKESGLDYGDFVLYITRPDEVGRLFFDQMLMVGREGEGPTNFVLNFANVIGIRIDQINE